MEKFVSFVVEFTKEHPTLALAGAAALGLVVGLLF